MRSLQSPARPVAGQPVRGGSVTLACTPGVSPSWIFPFTPIEHYTVTNLQEFQVLMYRPLYWYGSDGSPGVDDERSLAEPPRWSADGRTVTVTLKPWTWSDGAPLHADDIVLWMRLLEARKHHFGGYVPGCFPDNLTTFRAVNERSVSFTFDRAYSKRWVMMNQLSTITPLPRAWDAEGCLTEPAKAPAVWARLCADNEDREGWAHSPVWGVVNGPWRLDGCEDGIWTFVPNAAYGGAGAPWLDAFALRTSASNAEVYERMAAGAAGERAIDVGFLAPEFVTEPATDPTRGGPNPLGEHYTLVPQMTFRINYLALNFNNPGVAGQILRQAYVRQALQSVMDQEWAIRSVYRGYAYPTTGPIPLLPDSDLISPRQRTQRFPFAVAAARRLLREHGWDVSTTPAICREPERAGAGIPAGTPLRLALRYATGYPALAAIMERFRADAARAGIELVLTEAEQRVIADEDTTGAPGWELVCWNGGWIYSPAGHPTGELLFQSDANMNIGGYADARADELIARTLQSDALEELFAYQDFVAEQAPVIWMPNVPVRLLEVANDLRGVVPLNPFGMLTPEDWHYGTGACDDH